MKKFLMGLIVVLITATVVFAQGGKEAAAASQAKLAWYASAAHPYFSQVEKGVDAFIADNPDIEVRKLYGPDWEQGSEDQNLRTLAADGFSYITAYPSSGGAAGIFKELVSNGCGVISWGAMASKDSENFCVATDVEQAAYDACQAVIDAMGGEGGILNVLEVISDPNTQLRKKGIERCIKENPGVVLVQEVAGIENIDQANEKILAALTANIGKIKGIVCTGNITSDSTAQILTDYYARDPNAQKIYAIGIDEADTVMKAIKEDILFATIAQNPYGQGYISLEMLKLMSQGWKKVPGTYFVNSGSVVVTKENIGTYSNDIMAVTQKILGEIKGKYLTK